MSSMQRIVPPQRVAEAPATGQPDGREMLINSDGDAVGHVTNYAYIHPATGRTLRVVAKPGEMPDYAHARVRTVLSANGIQTDPRPVVLPPTNKRR